MASMVSSEALREEGTREGECTPFLLLVEFGAAPQLPAVDAPTPAVDAPTPAVDASTTADVRLRRSSAFGAPPQLPADVRLSRASSFAVGLNASPPLLFTPATTRPHVVSTIDARVIPPSRPHVLPQPEVVVDLH